MSEARLTSLALRKITVRSLALVGPSIHLAAFSIGRVSNAGLINDVFLFFLVEENLTTFAQLESA